MNPVEFSHTIAQSALDAHGPAASSIANIFWAMTIALGAIFLLVVIVFAHAVNRPNPNKRPGESFVLWLGAGMPAVVLLGILFYTLSLSRSYKITSKEGDKALRIQVIGNQWWWEARYPELEIVTANEIHLPVGREVIIELSSNDVIHSFWVPSLHGKLDALPDHPTFLTLQADRPGVYRGQCAEYCGTQHALMALYVVALPEEEFQDWVKTRKEFRLAAKNANLAGMEIFKKASCHTCHSIYGTEAKGLIGPDLTHVGSRLSLGAGSIKNGHGAMAGWIANSQAIKPGNHMPQSHLSPEDLKTLREFLMELK